MSKSTEISKKDIPEVTEIKTAVLKALDSGRARALSGVEKEAYSILELSKEQKKYKIKGSSTTLLSNRYKDAISELKKEGKLCTASNGKVKLAEGITERMTSSESAPNGTNISKTHDTPENGAKPSSETVQSQISKITTPTAENSQKASTEAKNSNVNETGAAKQDNVKAAATYQPPSYEKAAKDVSSASNTAKPWENQKSSAESNMSRFVPIALVVLGFFISVGGVPVVGLLVSVAGCALAYYWKNKKGKKVACPKATYIAGGIFIFLSLMLVASGYPNNTTSQQPSTNKQEAAQTQPATSDKTDGKLMFVVNAKGDVSENLVFQVVVSGTTSDGASVKDYYDAIVGTKYQLDNKAGDYEFSVSKDSLTQNEVVYSVSTKKVSYSTNEDTTVELTVSVDEAATKALADEKKKKEEEAAAAEAKKQEEAKKAEEAKAAAEAQKAQEEAAAAAQQQQEQSTSSNSSGQQNSQTVYVAPTKGKKYHSRKNCTGLSKANSVSPLTLSEAEAQGYTACSKCW